LDVIYEYGWHDLRVDESYIIGWMRWGLTLG